MARFLHLPWDWIDIFCRRWSHFKSFEHTNLKRVWFWRVGVRLHGNDAKMSENHSLKSGEPLYTYFLAVLRRSIRASQYSLNFSMHAWCKSVHHLTRQLKTEGRGGGMILGHLRFSVLRVFNLKSSGPCWTTRIKKVTPQQLPIWDPFNPFHLYRIIKMPPSGSLSSKSPPINLLLSYRRKSI